MKSGLSVITDGAQSVFDALRTLTRKDVLVGIPESGNGRDDGEIGNAAIGYINENGSPAQNIPARPHLKPGVVSVQPQTITHLSTAAQSALSGDQEVALRALERAGTVAADGVRRYITTTGFVPLAETTVSARKRRGRNGVKPLIDTGQYRRAITYVVRDKDADS